MALALLVGLTAQAQTLERTLELGPLQAGQHARAFHSFKHRLLLVALTSLPNERNACSANQYHFYDYQQQSYRQIQAKDLKVSPNFRYVIYAEPIRISAVTQAEFANFGENLKQIALQLQAPSALLEETGTMNHDGLSRCWFRPRILDLKSGADRAYPLILANQCKTGVCLGIEWEKSGKAKVWVRLKKDSFNSIRLSPGYDKLGFLTAKKPFTRTPRIQSNAIRVNIIKGERGEFRLQKSKRNETRLTWREDGIRLLRTGVDVKAANRLSQELKKALQEGKMDRAEDIKRFALWLDPDSEEIAYTALKAQALAQDFPGFFKQLRYGMDYRTRVQTCRKLHLDEDFKPLWKEEAFIQGFKENCP